MTHIYTIPFKDPEATPFDPGVYTEWVNNTSFFSHYYSSVNLRLLLTRSVYTGVKRSCLRIPQEEFYMCGEINLHLNLAFQYIYILLFFARIRFFGNSRFQNIRVFLKMFFFLDWGILIYIGIFRFLAFKIYNIFKARNFMKLLVL